MTYKSLEQRIAQKYIDLFTPFIPDKNASIKTSEQEEFYTIIKNLYQLVFDEPSLFVATLHEDEVSIFSNKEIYNTFYPHFRKFTLSVYDMLNKLFLMGKSKDVKLTKRQVTILSKLGIDNFNNLPIAWTWMSTRDNAEYIDFAYCMFDKNYLYFSDVYARLLGEKSFRRIEEWLKKRGYKCFIKYKVNPAGCPVFSLTYANLAWSDDEPEGGYDSKIKHTGISAISIFNNDASAKVGICIPNRISKTLLEDFNSMNEKLQEFVINRHTKCWDCRYCIQTDKTGERPKAYTSIVYNSNEYKLCQRFPGYAYNFSNMNDEIVDNFIEMLSFMEQYTPKSK